MKHLLRIFFLALIFLGCQPKNNPADTHRNQQGVTSGRTDTTEKEIVIDNIYTKIVDSVCNSVLSNDIEYTNFNTSIHVLTPGDSLDCFVFCSEATCGFLPGNCGRDIQVIKRTQEGYRVAFSACGNIYTTINEKKDHILSFLYGTQEGYIVKVFWDGREFEDKTISINNISYSYIIKIAEATRHNPTDFILYDLNHPNQEKIPVIVEDFQLGPNKPGKRFKVVFEQDPEVFIFENPDDHPKIILAAKGNDSIHVNINAPKEYYDIMVTTARQEKQLWKYNYKKRKYTRS